MKSDDIKVSVMTYHDNQLLYILNAIDVDTIKFFPLFAAALHFQVFHPTTDASGWKTDK